jgi:hypothetical protein
MGREYRLGRGFELAENVRLLSLSSSLMKIPSPLFLLLAAPLAALPVQAQEQVWRCGNEYTNNVAQAKQRGCKVMEGGNVTVVQTPRAQPSTSAPSTASSAARSTSPVGGPRVDGVEQRVRDGEARSVLESELRRAEAQQAQLKRDYNNGEPEKQGAEARNYQKYLDRVAEMKAQIERNDSDIAGIRREIGRLPAGATP